MRNGRSRNDGDDARMFRSIDATACSRALPFRMESITTEKYTPRSCPRIYLVPVCRRISRTWLGPTSPSLALFGGGRPGLGGWPGLRHAPTDIFDGFWVRGA